MSTIFDVAEKAKVSVITVSRLLNNPDIVSANTAKKILQAMEELNYQPSQIARSLVKKRTNTIGVIMPNIKNTFFNSWYRFIEDYANSHGFNLLLCNTDNDPVKEMKYIKLFQSQRVDGILIVPAAKKSVEYLIKSKINFILTDRLYKDLKANFVTNDHYQGAYEATEYLIELGHKKIAVLKGPGKLFPDVERYAGYKDAMEKHGIKIDESLVLDTQFNEELAAAATEKLMTRKEKPTAIFPFNSLTTIGAIKSILDLGLKIPDDVSLLSYDEIPGYEIFRPKITHISQPVSLLGKDSMLALIEIIKNPNSNKRTKIYLKPKLVIGDSCAKISS